MKPWTGRYGLRAPLSRTEADLLNRESEPRREILKARTSKPYLKMPSADIALDLRAEQSFRGTGSSVNSAGSELRCP